MGFKDALKETWQEINDGYNKPPTDKDWMFNMFLFVGMGFLGLLAGFGSPFWFFVAVYSGICFDMGMYSFHQYEKVRDADKKYLEK